MKTNGYFNNLEKYWSANFLALISSTNLIVVIIATLLYVVSYYTKVITIPEFGPSHNFNFFEAFILQNACLYSVSCCLAACFAILYILVLSLPKRTITTICSVIVLTIFSVFFYQYYQVQEDMWTGGAIFLVVFIFSNLLSVPLTLIIYSILLLFEKMPHFRVPETTISQNILFRKFVKFSYWYYIVMLMFGFFMILYFIIT